MLVSRLASWVARDGGLVQSRAVLFVTGPGNSGQPVVDIRGWQLTTAVRALTRNIVMPGSRVL